MILRAIISGNDFIRVSAQPRSTSETNCPFDKTIGAPSSGIYTAKSITTSYRVRNKKINVASRDSDDKLYLYGFNLLLITNLQNLRLKNF